MLIGSVVWSRSGMEPPRVPASPVTAGPAATSPKEDDEGSGGRTVADLRVTIHAIGSGAKMAALGMIRS